MEQRSRRCTGSACDPVLERKTLERAEPIFFAHEGSSAIRDGKWKLVAKNNDVKSDKWELYDMSVDQSEAKTWRRNIRSVWQT